MLEHKTYNTIVNNLLADPRVSEGNLFGMPVLKISGKPFVGLYKKDLVVKLRIDRVQEMLKAKAGTQFDPSGMKRPMKEWIRLKEPTGSAQKKWLALAEEAKTFVDQK